TGLAADTYDPRLSLSSTDGTGITVEYDDGADASILGIDARSDAGDITGQDVTVNSALVEGDLIINGVDIGAVDADNTDAATQAGLYADAINALSNEHGVVASVDGDALVLNSVSGAEMSIELSANGI